MRPMALGLAVLVSGSVLDARAVTGQRSNASAFQSSPSTVHTNVARGGSPGGSSLRARLLTALAGGVVGAGLGFFASQVVTSDWKANSDDEGIDRRPWAAVGASIGFSVGFSFPIVRRSSAPRPAVARPRNEAITEQEIRASSARSLPELLREKRPAWLRSRGVDVLTPSRDPVKAPGVRVYLNGGLLGGLHALTEVSIDVVTRVEFFDAEAAVIRWGAGNEDGAILLVTRAPE